MHRRDGWWGIVFVFGLFVFASMGSVPVTQPVVALTKFIPVLSPPKGSVPGLLPFAGLGMLFVCCWFGGAVGAATFGAPFVSSWAV